MQQAIAATFAAKINAPEEILGRFGFHVALGRTGKYFRYDRTLEKSKAVSNEWPIRWKRFASDTFRKRSKLAPQSCLLRNASKKPETEAPVKVAEIGDGYWPYGVKNLE